MPNNTLSVSTIEVPELPARAGDMREQGFRLVQIQSTRRKEQDAGSKVLELTYSFDKEGRLENLRLQFEQGEEIPSISSVFPAAFLYENELHDLFGISVLYMSIDYKGAFYRTAVPTPFNQPAKETGGNNNG